MIADGTIAGGMIPKVRAASTPCATASVGRTSSTVACRTCCCSRSSPTPASARWWSDMRERANRRCTASYLSPHVDGACAAMSSHHFATDGLNQCPFMPVFGPPPVMFVRGRGHRAVGRRRASATSTSSSGLAVTSLGHAHPVVADALAHQAVELLHVSNFFANPVATSAAIDIDRLLAGATGHDGQVFFTNSGAEANECALKLARKHGGRGRHVVVSALRQLPRSHAGHTRRHRAADQARAVPADARRLPPRRLGRVRALRGAVDASVAAVLIEPVQGEGGVNPAPAGYLAAIRRAVRRDRRADDRSTRSRPASAAPADGSGSSTTASRPTWSRWPRRWATACRSAPVGRGETSPPCSSLETTAAPSAAPPSPLPRSSP